MRNRGIIIGVAVGVAALTAAGVLMARHNRKSGSHDGESQLADTFKSKLHNLQRKAKKEFKNAAGESGDIANMAKERANQWVNKTSANL